PTCRLEGTHARARGCGARSPPRETRTLGPRRWFMAKTPFDGCTLQRVYQPTSAWLCGEEGSLVVSNVSESRPFALITLVRLESARRSVSYARADGAMVWRKAYTRLGRQIRRSALHDTGHARLRDQRPTPSRDRRVSPLKPHVRSRTPRSRTASRP